MEENRDSHPFSSHPASDSTSTAKGKRVTVPIFSPRLIAWEVTRSCMLACKHCRAAARCEPYEGELSTDECFRLLDNIASFAKPIIILTGGEPMLRPDIYEIAAHSTSLGLRTVMAPCGALIDDESAAKIRESGITHISISIDGATAESHDAFRGVPGAFAGSMRGLEAAKRAGLEFQINTTITQHNLAELPAILDLAIELGAGVFNPFLLVPTGRGKDLANQEISAAQYEQTLRWFATQQQRDDIAIRVTCAPHYQRILRQARKGDRLLFSPESPSDNAESTREKVPVPFSRHVVKGCMGGQSFAFISHRGIVQICGFLDTPCGDVRAEGLDFKKIWDESEVFAQMRDIRGYHGRCGRCEYGKVCGGCRARAFAFTGDYLAEEPFCLYQPRKNGDSHPFSSHPPSNNAGSAEGKRVTVPIFATMDDLDKRILSVIQTDFPVTPRPFDDLAERLDAGADDVAARVSRMRDSGAIRRLGAVFDSKRLGYWSTLVAARIPAERLDAVAATVSEIHGVTHNYRREHAYNLWFTLTAPSEARVEEILADLRDRTGIDAFFSLPALTVYKIRVNFDMTDGVRKGVRNLFSGSPACGSSDPAREKVPDPFSDEQKHLVRLLQASLPETREPFNDVAAELGWPVDRVIEQIVAWREAGVIRRFGAVVRHQRLGFSANGMSVYRVSPDRIDAIGYKLAERPEISHCYHRPALEDFPYTLFGMIHGRDEAAVRALAADLAAEHHIDDYDVLFSTTEFKKVSMKYFMEPDDT